MVYFGNVILDVLHRTGDKPTENSGQQQTLMAVKACKVPIARNRTPTLNKRDCKPLEFHTYVQHASVLTANSTVAIPCQTKCHVFNIDTWVAGCTHWGSTHFVLSYNALVRTKECCALTSPPVSPQHNCSYV
jgi:hypothetical protein